ncbi:hypothetical protein B9R42_05435 [Arthrospira platensis PCC 7345]
MVAYGSRFYFTPSVPRFNLTGYDSSNWGWLPPLLSTSRYNRRLTTSSVLTFCLDPEFPALLRFLQASGHINSYGMV